VVLAKFQKVKARFCLSFLSHCRMKYSHQPQRLSFSLERLHFADERPGYHITNSPSLPGA